MKRSKSIRLVLLGGLSAGAVTGCDPPNEGPPEISATALYTNNHFLPGVGYYHAPFRAWYARPYNEYNPESALYYYGGQWGAAPHVSITNLSSPTPEAARLAQAHHSPTPRQGFGSSSHRYSLWS